MADITPPSADQFPLVKPEYAAFLAAFPGLPTHVPPAELLRPALAAIPPPALPPAIATGRIVVSNTTFAARDGTRLRMLVVSPAAAAAAAANPSPVVMFVHGGGLLCGVPEINLIPMTAFAQAGFVVVSVDYRLCPEVSFPTPFLDVLDGLRHLASAASELHIDVGRGVVLLGFSAGSGIAASIALYASNQNDDNDIPRIALVILDSPLVDDRLDMYDSSSIAATQQRYHVWTRQNALDSLRYIAPSSLSQRVDDVWFSANRASDDELRRLPRHFFSIPAYDALRDGALAYAGRVQGLLATRCEVRLYDETIHGAVELVPTAPCSVAMVDDYVQAARTAVGHDGDDAEWKSECGAVGC